MDLWEGILIGAVGGASASLLFWLVKILTEAASNYRHYRRILRWLRENTQDEPHQESKTTQEIASWTDLPVERVRFLCSTHPGIHLCLDKSEEERWSIWRRQRRSVYEKEGLSHL